MPGLMLTPMSTVRTPSGSSVKYGTITNVQVGSPYPAVTSIKKRPLGLSILGNPVRSQYILRQQRYCFYIYAPNRASIHHSCLARLFRAEYFQTPRRLARGSHPQRRCSVQENPHDPGGALEYTRSPLNSLLCGMATS